MSETILVALLSLLGTLIGTFGGIVTGSKLMMYRIEQLEKKVEKHNGVIERTFKLEGEVLELQHDIRDIKSKLN
ncbi:MAG: hypothetical protein J6J30_04595 [Clostridia bacterium]|nr:hypothetical protein [Clostridia bacterium]